MKDQVAASTVAFASLQREGFVPSGDLVLIVVADEEVGGVAGTTATGFAGSSRRIPKPRAATTRSTRAAGERLVLGGTPVYLCATAEKMSAPFKLRVHGRSGHASMPGIADNALVKAARYVEALGAYEPEPELIPEARGFLEAVLGEAPPVEEALAPGGELHPSLPALVQPLLALTLSPTMIDASHQANVIPALCEVTVDCRLLPEQTPADAEPLIRAVLGDGDYELEWISATGGTRSDLATPLWDALEGFVAGIEPERGSRRSRAPASPTATTSARRTARSRTGSSRSRRWTRRRRRSSCTPRTSASRWTTSRSASRCCARPHAVCSDEPPRSRPAGSFRLARICGAVDHDVLAIVLDPRSRDGGVTREEA